MLRVAITTSDQQACGLYRVQWPAEELERRGKIELVPFPEIKLSCHQKDGEIVVDGVEEYPDADVLVMQRTAERQLVDSIPFFQERGIAVAIDVDDDLQHLPSGHAQFRYYARNMSGWRDLKRACRMADFVVASTPRIAEVYAPHGRSLVIRNSVPKRFLEIEAERDGRTVGWGGTVFNHPGDLQVTRGGVGEAVRECGARFMVVGVKADVRQALRLPEEPVETGIVDFKEYPRYIARLDVTIAPLLDNSYNQAKSWLKILEASALGVPWVASNTPEYFQFVVQGGPLGYIARPKSKDWYKGVRALLKDSSLREDEAQRGREIVREHFTIEKNCDHWLQAWRMASRNRQTVAA
jgi:glycosyltransferase involved in cell wall biosynthesis